MHVIGTLSAQSSEIQDGITSNFPEKFNLQVRLVENGSQVILLPSDGRANE